MGRLVVSLVTRRISIIYLGLNMKWMYERGPASVCSPYLMCCAPRFLTESSVLDAECARFFWSLHSLPPSTVAIRAALRKLFYTRRCHHLRRLQAHTATRYTEIPDIAQSPGPRPPLQVHVKAWLRALEYNVAYTKFSYESHQVACR